MTTRRCEPYVYKAVFRRVRNTALSAAEPWSHYSWSDLAMSGGDPAFRDYIGRPGGLTEADVLFRSNVLCDKRPTQFTSRAFVQSPVWSASGYSGNAIAAGVVTVKAFTHDASSPDQESAGYFLRMTTTLESFTLAGQPRSRGSRNNFGFVALVPETWTPSRWLEFARPEDVSYEDEEAMYRPLPISSVFAGNMIESDAAKRASWGNSPCFGFSYSLPLYKFEFGTIAGGSLAATQTFFYRLHSQWALSDSFYLTLGVHSRSAYATIGMNSVNPCLCFTPLVFDSTAPAIADTRRQIDYVQKSPVRFRVQTESSGGVTHVPYLASTQATTLSQATGAAPLHQVYAVEGRHIDNINAVVATKSQSIRGTQQQFADLFAFGRPLCRSAAGESQYQGTWPTKQPQTDIALNIETPHQRAGVEATIRMSIAANSQDAAAKRASALAQKDIGIRSECFALPWWIIADNKQTTQDAPQTETYETTIPYQSGDYPQYTMCDVGAKGYSSGILSRSSQVGNTFGEYGNITLPFRQTDDHGSRSPGEWRAKIAPNIAIAGTTTQDPEPTTYRVSFSKTTRDLWNVWDNNEGRGVDVFDRQQISRDNHGIPPGYESIWEADKQAFINQEVSKFVAAAGNVRMIRNGSEQTTLRSVEGIGAFSTYGQTFSQGGIYWEQISQAAPASTVDQRLKFSENAIEKVGAYDNSYVVPDGVMRKPLRAKFQSYVWANTETQRQAEIWSCSSRTTTEEKEISFSNSGGVGSQSGNSVLGFFFGAISAAIAPVNVRMIILNCFLTTYANKLTDIETKTHNRIVLWDEFITPPYLDMNEETGQFSSFGPLATQLVSGISCEWV